MVAKTESPSSEEGKESGSKEAGESTNEEKDEPSPAADESTNNRSKPSSDSTDKLTTSKEGGGDEDKKEEEETISAENPKDSKLEEQEVKESSDEEVAATNKSSNNTKNKLQSSSKKRKTSPTNTRDRRERKTVKSFSPVEPPKAEQPQAITTKGRGIRLSELDHVNTAIQNAALDDLTMAYKFLFSKTRRGKIPKSKKELKQTILAFSGYLPERNVKLSKSEQAEVDEEYEVKMGQKAYKLMVNQLKKMCDTFGIDRRGMSGNKEDLVNCLLDFLGEPMTMDKFEKIRSTSTAASKKNNNKKDTTSTTDAKEAADDMDVNTDDYWEDAMLPDGAEVTDETLRLWVRAFVRCHNIKNTTLKQAVAIATEKFGVDMSDKSSQIKELLVAEA